MDDIRGFTVKDCRDFYRTHYAPSNATIVIAGDFSEFKTLSLVQKHYGGLSGVRRVERRRVSKEPPQRAERVFQLPAPTPTEKILLGYRVPSFLDPDTPALVLANEVLFGGQSSRLHRLFCLDEELALSVRGSISPFVDPGLFEMWILLREGKKKTAALALLDRELDRLGSEGPTPIELEKAISQLELSFLHSMETAGGKAEQIGFYETVANDGAAVFERLEAYREVSTRDVKQAVAKYLRPSRRTRIEILRRAS
jgi:zinc protease